MICKCESPGIGTKRSRVLHQMILRVVQLQRPVSQQNFIPRVIFPGGAKIATPESRLKAAPHQKFSAIHPSGMKDNSRQSQMALITVRTEIAVRKLLVETVAPIAVTHFESQPRRSPLPDHFPALAAGDVLVAGVVLP